jgi:hypothetical protein
MKAQRLYAYASLRKKELDLLWKETKE